MCPSYQESEADASVRLVRSLSSRQLACRVRKLTTRSKRFRSFLSLRGGKPNNTEGRPELLLGGQPAPLDQGIGTVSVVLLTATGGFETNAVIQRERGDVVAADLEGGVGSTVLACPLQQRREKTTAMAPLTLVGIHRQHRDVQFIHDEPTAGHSGQAFLVPHQPKAEATGILQFGAPLLSTPEPVQRPFVQNETCRQPAGIEIDHRHPEPAGGTPIPTLPLFAGPS